MTPIYLKKGDPAVLGVGLALHVEAEPRFAGVFELVVRVILLDGDSVQLVAWNPKE